MMSSLVLTLLLPLFTNAATITYNFNTTWVTANPDGAAERPVIGINGLWPLPYITATVGDNVVVNMLNLLGNQTTSLHFHGLYMNGTNEMDGTAGVTQCAIAPGESFVYNFTIDQPGTYWYHSHQGGQYPDGLRGALVINDPESPFKGKYDEERVLTLSDWYHDQMPSLISSYINLANPTGAEPVPNAALMNDTQNLTTPVEPGRTYLFRIINIGAFASQYLWFEDHTMQVVEVDGIYTEAAEADMIYLTAAQRYSVLIKTKEDASANFAYVSSMDKDLFDKAPDSLNPNVTGWLVYDQSKELPTPALLDEFNEFDDFTLVPKDGEGLLDKVDYSFNLAVKMDNLGDGANYAFFNDVTYVAPKVPTLYSALSTGPAATNASVYGDNTNAFVLNKMDVVEIVLNNNDAGKHPFHLHGHNFQAVVRSDKDAGDYVGNATFPKIPMRRDTFMKFQANIFSLDRSRIWLFHCHVEWHILSGLVATMIEDPLSLQGLRIPPSHFDVCKSQGIATAGNAAGNTADLYDLTGANVPPPPLPAGFTARGIVALVFSILSALIGVGVVGWYGAGEIGKKEPDQAVKEAITAAPEELRA